MNIIEESTWLDFDIKPILSQVHCAVCNSECDNTVDDSGIPSNYNDNSYKVQKPTLKALCNILKVSNICEILRKANKNAAWDYSQEDKIFCSICSKRILEGVRIHKDMERLQEELVNIITNLKSSIVLSYKRQEKENLDETDLEKFIRVLRHSLNQCWTNVQVQLNPMFPSKKRRPGRLKCGRKRTTFSLKTPPLIGSNLLMKETLENAETDPKIAALADKFHEAAEVGSDPKCENSFYGLDVDEKAIGAISEHKEDTAVEQDLEKKVEAGSFQCNLCSKIFCREKNLKVHQNRKHAGANGFNPKSQTCSNKCPFGKKIFLEADSTLSGKNNCEVPGCNKIGASFNHLKSHHQRKCPKRQIFSGRNKKNTVYRCDPCSKTFETATAYKHHQLSIHEQRFKYCCEICGHGAQAESMLIRHMLVHSDEKTMQCEQCDYKCKRPSQLMYHKRIHTNEYPHLCQVCGKTFRLNNKLQQHLASHAASKEFQCHLCGKFFASKNYVTNHINSFHNRKFLKRSVSSNNTTHNQNYVATTIADNPFHKGVEIKNDETIGCEETESTQGETTSTTTIILHITEGIMENISENHTVLEI